MKAIILYGPPAAGKLTVGKLLAELTGYKLLHNHLTIDLARVIFPKNGPDRSALVNKMRADILESASKAGVDLIVTEVYAAGIDDELFASRVAAIEDNGGEVCYVQLTPSKDELMKRVSDESRMTTSKIKDNETLLKNLADYDMYSSVEHSSNFQIDNTNIDPAEVAQMIIRHFGLK